MQFHTDIKNPLLLFVQLADHFIRFIHYDHPKERWDAFKVTAFYHLIHDMKLIAYFLASLIFLISACDNNEIMPEAGHTITQSEIKSATHGITDESKEASTHITQFELGNKRYLFDVTSNTQEALRALLIRIDEITEAHPKLLDQLEIVMVLHGPDINWFTEKNYIINKELVDLAAQLDALKVVDMKICETTMDSLGITQSDIPAFIETVPFAPDTLNHLRSQGYIHL